MYHLCPSDCYRTYRIRSLLHCGNLAQGDQPLDSGRAIKLIEFRSTGCIRVDTWLRLSRGLHKTPLTHHLVSQTPI